MDNIQQTNVHVIKVPEGEEWEDVAEKLFGEIVTEKVPNLEKEMDIQVQEAQRAADEKNPRRPHCNT